MDASPQHDPALPDTPPIDRANALATARAFEHFLRGAKDLTLVIAALVQEDQLLQESQVRQRQAEISEREAQVALQATRSSVEKVQAQVRDLQAEHTTLEAELAQQRATVQAELAQCAIYRDEATQAHETAEADFQATLAQHRATLEQETARALAHRRLALERLEAASQARVASLQAGAIAAEAQVTQFTAQLATLRQQAAQQFGFASEPVFVHEGTD